MNFFSKNKFVFWLLVFLIVINLSALITILVLFSQKSEASKQLSKEKPGKAFSKELSLSPAQSEKVDVILADYRSTAEPIANNIRTYRSQLLKELSNPNPDTNKINSCVEEICQFQKQMQKASIDQYLSLKEICTPVQCERLSTLYYELYGCQGKCKEMQQGKGKLHQHRNGQRQQGCGNMDRNDSCGKLTR